MNFSQDFSVVKGGPSENMSSEGKKGVGFTYIFLLKMELKIDNNEINPQVR